MITQIPFPRAFFYVYIFSSRYLFFYFISFFFHLIKKMFLVTLFHFLTTQHTSSYQKKEISFSYFIFFFCIICVISFVVDTYTLIQYQYIPKYCSLFFLSLHVYKKPCVYSVHNIKRRLSIINNQNHFIIKCLWQNKFL